MCMIVKNEEAYLEKCLSSARNVVDEIIVVDTGSTDRTIDIARQYGAKVITFEWGQDFSAARNLSLEQATGDWILYLDADEELVEVDKEAFLQLLKDPKVEGYYFRIISPTAGETGDQGLRHLSLRLFRNRPGYRFQGALHEQIVPSILATNPSAQLWDSGLYIYHHGYKQEVVGSRNKVSRNLDILQKQMEKAPQDSYLRYNLGVALYEAGDLAGALREWENVEQKIDIRAGYAPTFFRNYAIALLKDNQPLRALEVAERGLSYFPDYTDLHYLRGQALEQLERYTQSQDAFLRCLELGEAPARYVTSIGVGSYLALYKLGELMEKCGYYELAINYYQKAFHLQPELPGLLSSLGRVLKRVLHEPLQVRAYIQDHIKITSFPQLLQVVDLLYSSGDYYGCLLYLNEYLLRTGTKTDEIRLLKAKALMQLNRWEEAKYQCVEIGPESPYYLDALLYICICNWSTRPRKNSLPWITKLRGRDDKLYSILEVLNRKIMWGEEPADELDVVTLEGLIVKLVQVNNWDLARMAATLILPQTRAETSFKEASTEASSAPKETSTEGGTEQEAELCYLLGRALFNHKFYLEAADELLRALEAGLSRDDLFYMLGFICAQRQALWEAEQLLHQAIRLNPEKKEYYEELVEVLLKQTCQTLKETLAHFPDSPEVKDILTRVKDCQLQLRARRGVPVEESHHQPMYDRQG
ncbi:Glycosyltransferase involved in cell wall bisynthesis [Thermanaeromonas toyohensis ToBE]|uniref:Glycosyltransferase involved in cell wall bisynthesis n=1 Tax=Thermanaeromonas toyohensis ToBE TaxID=698762 RepID=A0A1W1VZ49_9FIRM|nr:Glycosyltransferase involved in cell wall bisynthesis [Thermanaeromonas toyohensis ToBE]